MYLPRNRTSWDEYMLKDISKYKFYDRSQLVRLRGKYTVQTAHCAMVTSLQDCSTIFSEGHKGNGARPTDQQTDN